MKEEQSYTIMLDSQMADADSAYRETPLPPVRRVEKTAKPHDAEPVRLETPLPPARREEKAAKPRDVEPVRLGTPLVPVRREEKAAKPHDAGTVYRETALPADFGIGGFPREIIPEKLRKMRRMYEYGRESMESKAKNFYRQGMFMKDYEDDYPWEWDFTCYYPTYHELTTKQLRGYFSWRTLARRGEYRPIATSAAYIYVYELLNGIGAESPEDSLRKLVEFMEGFLDAGYGDARMRFNVQRWMLDYAIIEGLPKEAVLQYADKEQVQRDADLTVLRSPEACTDEEVCVALFRMSGRAPDKSPVVTGDPTRGMHLIAEVWRLAAADYRREDKDLFTLCFGQRHVRPWHPLSNAVCYLSHPDAFCDMADFPAADRVYTVNECRLFRYTGGTWQVEAYEKLYFDREFLRGFLQETDLLLRRYLKTGRYLRENERNKWAAPYAAAVIEADRQAAILAARPKISIDLSGLEQIRRDALKTQNSLLVDEKSEELMEGFMPPLESGMTSKNGLMAEVRSEESPSEEFRLEGKQTEEMRPKERPIEGVQTEGVSIDLPLNETHLRILRLLLAGSDVSGIIREQHLMSSIVADSINEALFDEIGDTVVSCDDERISLVEDYIEELEELLGGA